MRSIALWSARYRVLVLGSALAVIILGVLQLPNAPVDALPEFSPPHVEVQTEALGLSPEEVEQLITVPLEADLLNGVAWLESIESQSVQGLSSILLTFEPGTDPIRARQMVAERLTQAHAIPNVSKPPVMLQPLSSSNRVMMVSLTSDELSLLDMSVLARWTIRPRLMGVPGVANVAIWGQRERQLQVLVDPERLHDAGVSLDDVIETTGNALWVSPLTYLEASTPGTGGFIDTPQQRLGVQHILPIDSAEDLSRVVIAEDLRLGDVAEVVEDHQPLIGDAIVDEAPGLMLVIEKFPESNTLATTEAIDAALAAIAPGLRGVEIDATIFRAASFVESGIASTAIAGLIGLLLLATLITGVLRDWRAAFVTLVTLPVAFILAALMLQLLGATVNAMLVAGFIAAVTVVVDDAIAGTAEVIGGRRSRRPEPEMRRLRVVRAVIRVRGPMVYATVALLLAAGPLLLIGDVSGAFIPSLLAAYAAAVIASMVVSLTVMPALASFVVGGPFLRSTPPRYATKLQRRYAAALARLVGRPRAVLVGVTALAGGVVVLFAVALAPQLGRVGLPDFRTDELLIHWQGPPGTSRTEMARVVSGATRELRAVDGVANVGALIGRAVTSDQVVTVNSAEIWVTMERGADHTSTVASVQAVVEAYPGLGREVLTYPADRARQILGQRVDDVVVRIFGQDLALMRSSAADVRDLLAGVPGITGARVEPQVDEPSIEIEVDLAAAGAHGLKPGDVRRAAATLLSGIHVGSLFEEQKVFDVVVWGVPAVRDSISAVSDLQIETVDSGLVSLDEVADVRVAPSATVIRRSAVQRVIDVGATISGRDAGAVLADIDAALASIEFPLESHAEVLGHTAAREEHRLTLIGVTAMAVIGFILLLQAAFSNWRLAALFFVSLVASLTGAVSMAVVLGEAGSIGALGGMLAVLAISTRTGILLVDAFRRLEGEANGPPGRDVVLRGASERLAPILLSTLAVAAFLVPFVVLGPRPGTEVLHPMALVILGGLVSATAVSLFLLPTLLLPTGASSEPSLVPQTMEDAPAPQAMGV